MLWKTRYCMKYSAWYHVFPATFHVLSRKIDFLWDSEHYPFPEVHVVLRYCLIFFPRHTFPGFLTVLYSFPEVHVVLLAYCLNCFAATPSLSLSIGQPQVSTAN